ncbi:maleylpyruvate isomerase family mycothiol-dependent enzyme [Streptomyces ipomoeae]|uniref:TIGR03083 family protein n=2 Tax=Streptomyces ipomoeae TaxID=103232 RepID=L1L9K9_9ACTN|nr:maleylpyruvate isomerase family mycothiol-dependent enzyme [Streptomyces ipomoeae]EKX69313.1 TIGR03083 family protein [Streptomyces ipomoeae 91-03]MDX2698644.1 maleylpyruvate isomerase family mycothiol-dependent enzyme [Streptomyces ipomoeae]MDX2844297.1 maleylpyruvate isomerase family mycothiol-dependent enzyme [Streptomyces ipomoeae]MDX2932995.1 maleylpyruvate isomerase family mycothiol-dependent enzyme [Streptomyces ipomoeae]TQE16505.1 maleylpyruvate isomerase family mycothiol-dependent 
MTAADTHDVRDPELPGRLLAAERDVLVPLLRGRPEEDFGVGTCCPGWSVRDVLAHCSAALSRVVEGRFEEGVFSPEANDRDIAERGEWAVSQIVDELERGMTDAGPVIAKAGGALDGIALGEWVHAGDVREAWGLPGAYGGSRLGLALPLLAHLTRVRGTLPLHADLDDLDEPLLLGAPSGDGPPARYIGDAATLVRLYSGRRPSAGTSYELAGATEAELNLYA